MGLMKTHLFCLPLPVHLLHSIPAASNQTTSTHQLLHTGNPQLHRGFSINCALFIRVELRGVELTIISKPWVWNTANWGAVPVEEYWPWNVESWWS